MELRKKFVLLALIYVVSLSANLAMSAYCIVVYFDAAFQDSQTGAFHQQQLEQARRTLKEERELLATVRNGAVFQISQKRLEQMWSSAVASVPRSLLEDAAKSLDFSFDEAVRAKDAAVVRWLEAPATQPESLSTELNQRFDELAGILLTATQEIDSRRREAVADSAEIQWRVVLILVANTAGGALLCALGVFLVRRWVLAPIGDLREATKQISQANFAYRVKPRSRDELGQLAGEVNQMSATVVQMQTQLVEQERLAAAGEMVTRLAHNIRNPLGGIRGLAEATLALHPEDEETVGCQNRIIATVDRFEKWLRDLQQSVSPLALNPRPVAIRELLDNVVTALEPMFLRRGVRVVIEVDPRVSTVELDETHFEQALVSLVTNAVQASEADQVVRILAEPVPENQGRWRLVVEDEGVGIPPELRKKIFMPYFTTKPQGNGLGLAMTHKVVRLHGGELSVESEVGHGSRFSVIMPGMIAEA